MNIHDNDGLIGSGRFFSILTRYLNLRPHSTNKYSLILRTFMQTMFFIRQSCIIYELMKLNLTGHQILFSIQVHAPFALDTTQRSDIPVLLITYD